MNEQVKHHTRQIERIEREILLTEAVRYTGSESLAVREANLARLNDALTRHQDALAALNAATAEVVHEQWSPRPWSTAPVLDYVRVKSSTGLHFEASHDGDGIYAVKVERGLSRLHYSLVEGQVAALKLLVEQVEKLAGVRIDTPAPFTFPAR